MGRWVNVTNRLTDTLAIMQAPGLQGAYVNGQKYRTTDKTALLFTIT